MLVYKYRGITVKDRDIDTLSDNKYYASLFKDLNDPFENTFNDEITVLFKKIKESFCTDMQLCQSLLDKIKLYNTKMGIYSLAKSPYNELMWAHYADSNKGFCIEYDLDKLKEETNFPLQLNLNCINVLYEKNPPIVDISDINNNKLLQKIFGTKSKSWEDEDEVRIISDNYGLISYYPSALKGIYFGYATDESLQNKIIDRITLPNIKFYKIIREEGKYSLNKVLLHENESTSVLNKQDFEYLTNHNPTVENFYIKYKKEFADQNSVKLFLAQFEKEFATKRVNVKLFDKDVDLSNTNNYIKYDDELENHKIAEIMIGIDDVIFRKLY